MAVSAGGLGVGFYILNLDENTMSLYERERGLLCRSCTP